MKEFMLTQPYNNLDEMLGSGEVAVYKEELEQGDIEKYAIVSRIGNRYDLNGKKIESFAKNPFYKKKEEIVVESAKIEIVQEDVKEIDGMKYYEIEALIENEIQKAVDEVKAQHEQELCALKEAHEQDIANAKAEAKAELIAKLNS